jgi:protein-S-isoprenylcysteine O-methyltransferase Ste14
MMTLDLAFRVTLLVLYLSLLGIWVFFQRRSSVYKQGMAQHGREQRQHEVGVLVLLRPLLGIPEHIAILVWLVAPSWMAWSALPLPMWMRWGGAVVAALALGLLGWSMAVLGRNFGATLKLRPDHTLVTTGPYRWVQHPIYLAFLLLQIGIALLTANWFIGVTGVGLILAVIAARTPTEAAQLRERFGESYHVYAHQTGRFWPKPMRRRATTNAKA